MNVRVPGWARGEAVPSDLYRFADTSKRAGDAPGQRRVRSGGARRRATRASTATGRRATSSSSSLPMPVRRVAANASVEADAGPRGAAARAARLRRGVAGQPGGHVRNLLLADASPLDLRVPTGPARRRAGRQDERPWRSPTTPEGEVRAAGAGPHRHPLLRLGQPRPGRDGGLDRESPERASGPSRCRRWLRGRRSRRRKAGQQPARGQRPGASRARPATAPAGFFHWWPEKGSTEWVAVRVRGADDRLRASRSTGSTTPAAASAACPARWRVLYKDGEEWKPVEATGPYGVAEGRATTGDVQAGHDERATPRGDAAAAVVGRHPGVEGRVALSTRAPRTPSTRARSPWPS